MFFEKIFAERLKALRQSQNLTLQQLGEKIGATKATIGNFENCNKQPSMAMAIKIADYFHVTVDYLLGLSDDPQGKIEITHVIPKKPFLIQDALGIPHPEYPNDFSVEIRGRIPPEALKELEDCIVKIKAKYVYNTPKERQPGD